jgi:hypothetical protein
MSTVRAIALAAAASLLAGCLQPPYHRTTQTGCEDSTRTFAEMEACLKNAISNAYTAREQAGNDVRYYFIKASDVANRVQKNETSEFNGRIELQVLYVDLRLKTEVQ